MLHCRLLDPVQRGRAQLDAALVRQPTRQPGASPHISLHADVRLSARSALWSRLTAANGLRLVGRVVANMAASAVPLGEERGWALYTLIGNALPA